MRTLTIGSTTLELKSFSKKWDKIAGVYAEISIPSTAISHDGVKALFTNNAEDLIVTAEDGSTETFSGYAELHSIKEDIQNGVYIVVQYCTSNAMHLLNEAKKQIDEQQNVMSAMQTTIDAQTNALQNHADVITAQNEQLVAQAQTIAEQGNTIVNQGKKIETQKALIDEQTEQITAQTEQVAVLEETSVMQTATIESLLLEIIPAVISDAVTVAVAEALASNSTTEEETEVVE